MENIVAELDIPEAKKLADLVSISQDLNFCIDCCERLVGLLESDSKESTLIQSLWTSALISYVRCFATGKRFGLSEDILLKFEGEPIEVHNYYKNLRDKNIAHSVNPFEQIKIGVVLSHPDSEKEVLGIANLGMKHISGVADDVRQLAQIALTFLAEVAKLRKDAQDQTLIAAKKIPIADLYRQPRMQLVAPSGEQAGKARQF